MDVKWSDLPTDGAIQDAKVLEILTDLAFDANAVRVMIKRLATSCRRSCACALKWAR